MEKNYRISYKVWKIFYFIIFLIGCVLLFFEISIYRRTIIKTVIPLSIIIVSGFVLFLCTKKHYGKTFSGKGVFFPLVQSIFSWGFIACYFFMASNFYFASNLTQEYFLPIKKKSSMPGPRKARGERQPLVTVDYFGFDKELVFKYADTKKVNQADSVIIKIRKGALGFDVLDSYDVIIK